MGSGARRPDRRGRLAGRALTSVAAAESSPAAVRITGRELALATLALAATLSLAFALVPHGYAYEHTWEYEKMIAGRPASVPFAWRVLVPWLLAHVPLPPRQSFFLSTFASSLLTSLALLLLARARGVAPRAALVTAQLAAFSYPIALYLGYWGMVDPVSNLWVALVLLAMAWDRWSLAVIALALGTLTKETTLALAPLAAWWWWRRGDAAAPRLARAAALLIVPAALFLTVRRTVHAVPGPWDVRGIGDLVHFWRTLWAQKAGTMGWPVWFAGVFLRSYGFFWVTAAIGFALERSWRGVALYLLLASVALCAVATDWARMLGFGFAGVFLPTAGFLDRLDRDGRGVPWLVALLTLAAVQCWLALAPFVPMSPWLARVHPAATLAVFVAGAAVALAARRSMRAL